LLPLSHVEAGIGSTAEAANLLHALQPLAADLRWSLTIRSVRAGTHAQGSGLDLAIVETLLRQRPVDALSWPRQRRDKLAGSARAWLCRPQSNY